MVEEIYPKLPLVICMDGVVGEQVSRYKESEKTVILTEIAEGIRKDKISSGLLKESELIDEKYFPIKTDKYTDILDTPSNPMVLVWTDFRGNDVDFTPELFRRLSMKREETKSQEMQILRLKRRYRQATSDIAREVVEREKTFEPIEERIEKRRPLMPTVMRKTKKVPL